MCGWLGHGPQLYAERTAFPRAAQQQTRRTCRIREAMKASSSASCPWRWAAAPCAGSCSGTSITPRCASGIPAILCPSSGCCPAPPGASPVRPGCPLRDARRDTRRDAPPVLCVRADCLTLTQESLLTPSPCTLARYTRGPENSRKSDGSTCLIRNGSNLKRGKKHVISTAEIRKAVLPPPFAETT